MTRSAIWKAENQTCTVTFSDPEACLPVATRDGGKVFVPWGRRTGEEGQLPGGGDVALEAINRGHWQSYRPRPVLLLLSYILALGLQQRDHWLPVQIGECVQGLLARIGREQRVYVVTVLENPGTLLHGRYPRIVNASASIPDALANQGVNAVKFKMP